MSDQAQALRARKGGRLFLLLAVGFGLLFLLGRALSAFYVEVLWFRSLGYGSVFWTRTWVELAIKAAAGGTTAVLAYMNFKVVARTLSALQIKRKFGNLEIAERLPKKAIQWAVALFSVLLGLWLGAAFPSGAGLRLLLFLRAPEWGLEVPWLGKDVSFFVFALPIVGGVLILGLALLFLLISFSAAGYAGTGSFSFTRGRVEIADLPRKHLTTLVSVFLLFLAARFWLAPYLLMLDGNSGVQGIFGFTDATARITGYRALGFIAFVASGVTLWAGFRKRLMPLVASGIAVVLAGLILVQAYPELVQRFQVEPNELDRETPFIQANLEFTRMGFGLDRVQERDFEYLPEESPDWGDAARQFAGLPIWTPGALLTTFQSIETFRSYYRFENVTVDRYPSPAGVTPVAVAVREIDPGGVDNPTWLNLHLRTRLPWSTHGYLAGMGAVAAAVNQRTPEGRPVMFLSGVPPVATGGAMSPEALSLPRSAVYFSSRDQSYAIVNLESPLEGDASPDSELGPGTSSTSSDFQGAGDGLAATVPSRGTALTPFPQGLEETGLPVGIRISNIFRKLALAWSFRDANLLFASEVTEESRFVLRRNVLERAAALAPFLRFMEAPYPVLDEGRVVWILEGFTSTRHFPLSTTQDHPGTGASTYIRNSVKVTVDALTGEIRFYRIDAQDPLLEAWARVFPDLFQPFEDMPSALQAHIRYPRELLQVQARVLLQYHQEDPAEFHGQQDLWALPQEQSQGTRRVAYAPEYGLYRLPGEDDPEFLLSTVFVPAGRQNLSALLAARCDAEGYGDLLLFNITDDEQVPGPRQVEALVDQDPTISQQFSLWRQGGSQTWSGHLHVIPVGGTLLYLEPIFLAAEADAIPELRRFVVSDGRRVAMEPTLEEAITALALSGGEGDLVLPSLSGPEEGGIPTPGRWPSEALDLLNTAEERLSSGDWAGFGEALDELRAMLRNLSGASSGG